MGSRLNSHHDKILERIKKVNMAKNLSQRAIAKKFGISRSGISEIISKCQVSGSFKARIDQDVVALENHPYRTTKA